MISSCCVTNWPHFVQEPSSEKKYTNLSFKSNIVMPGDWALKKQRGSSSFKDSSHAALRVSHAKPQPRLYLWVCLCIPSESTDHDDWELYFTDMEVVEERRLICLIFFSFGFAFRDHVQDLTPAECVNEQESAPGFTFCSLSIRMLSQRRKSSSWLGNI